MGIRWKIKNKKIINTGNLKFSPLRLTFWKVLGLTVRASSYKRDECTFIQYGKWQLRARGSCSSFFFIKTLYTRKERIKRRTSDAEINVANDSEQQIPYFSMNTIQLLYSHQHNHTAQNESNQSTPRFIIPRLGNRHTWVTTRDESHRRTTKKHARMCKTRRQKGCKTHTHRDIGILMTANLKSSWSQIPKAPAPKYFNLL